MISTRTVIFEENDALSQVEFSDKEVMASLLDFDNPKGKASAWFYRKEWPKIQALVTKNGGNSIDAQDIMQDSMVVLFRNIRDEKFEGHSQLSTYFYSICRWQWYSIIKKRQQERQWCEEIPVPMEDETNLVQHHNEEKLVQIVEKMEEPCKSVLIESYFKKKKMKEIAQVFHYKNEQNARNKKYQCLKKLKEIIRQNPNLFPELKVI